MSVPLRPTFTTPTMDGHPTAAASVWAPVYACLHVWRHRYRWTRLLTLPTARRMHIAWRWAAYPRAANPFAACPALSAALVLQHG
jgi:hypothetical protein